MNTRAAEYMKIVTRFS